MYKIRTFMYFSINIQKVNSSMLQLCSQSNRAQNFVKTVLEMFTKPENIHKSKKFSFRRKSNIHGKSCTYVYLTTYIKQAATLEHCLRLVAKPPKSTYVNCFYEINCLKQCLFSITNSHLSLCTSDLFIPSNFVT